jgi:hypothetical protein
VKPLNKVRPDVLTPYRQKNKKFFVNLKRLGIFATQHFSMFAANLFNGIKNTTVIIIVVLVIIIPVANGVGFNM